jgi:hypothetical protein
MLGDHKDLGVNSELLSDGFVDLIEKGVITGTRKRTHRNKVIATNALGSQRLYDFVDQKSGVEFWPVDHTNDERNISCEDSFVAVNATLEVDFLGQCASESLGSEYWSSSGGQPDFARGAIFAEHGRSFIVLHSTTANQSTSCINEASFKRAILYGTQFRETKMRNAVLIEANCEQANFKLADLRDADLTEAKLVKTNFEGAYVHGTVLTRAEVRDIPETQVDMSEAADGSEMLPVHQWLSQQGFTQPVQMKIE